MAHNSLYCSLQSTTSGMSDVMPSISYTLIYFGGHLWMIWDCPWHIPTLDTLDNPPKASCIGNTILGGIYS